jgi:hypothetical protein
VSHSAPSVNRRREKSRYRRRVKAKKCPGCAKPRVDGTIRCAECLRRRRAQLARRMRERIAEGCCIRCLGVQDRPGKTECSGCAYRRKLVAAGVIPVMSSPLPQGYEEAA